MAIYHLSCQIISRSKGRSAVAAAAYRSGSKMRDEVRGRSYDYSAKREVSHSEILIPDEAPREFKNREYLWNSVERAEKSGNAQLAREINVALPRELSHEQHIQMLREYCQKNFVSRGMICDLNIHSKDGNPHAHIMLSLRKLDDKGKFMPKRKDVFVTDANGNRVPVLDKNGKQKIERKTGRKLWQRETVKTTDWDEQSNMDLWRQSWQDVCNARLGKDNHISCLSFERKKVPYLVPQIHVGMESSLKHDARWRENQAIIEANRIIKERLFEIENQEKLIEKYKQEEIKNDDRKRIQITDSISRAGENANAQLMPSMSKRTRRDFARRQFGRCEREKETAHRNIVFDKPYADVGRRGQGAASDEQLQPLRGYRDRQDTASQQPKDKWEKFGREIGNDLAKIIVPQPKAAVQAQQMPKSPTTQPQVQQEGKLLMCKNYYDLIAQTAKYGRTKDNQDMLRLLKPLKDDFSFVYDTAGKNFYPVPRRAGHGTIDLCSYAAKGKAVPPPMPKAPIPLDGRGMSIITTVAKYTVKAAKTAVTTVTTVAKKAVDKSAGADERLPYVPPPIILLGEARKEDPMSWDHGQPLTRADIEAMMDMLAL